jgi:hypothetical protein
MLQKLVAQVLHVGSGQRIEGVHGIPPQRRVITRWPREDGMGVAPFVRVWQTSAHGRGSERHRSRMP